MAIPSWPASYGAFKRLSQRNLVRLYDDDPAVTKFERRDVVAELHERFLGRHTRCVTIMTAAILFLTVVNVVVVCMAVK